jgi:hypothetical protein
MNLKDEQHWIDVTQSGGMWSVWIADDCVVSLGGAFAGGD